MRRIEVKTLHSVRLVTLIAFVASVATIASVAPVTSMRTHPMSALNSPGSMDSRGSITVHAAGRGNPWINLSEGRDLPTGYTGATKLRQVLEQNLARPLALASADFDEDGVPDLICGYAGPGGGIITLHRGNVDSIYPNAPEAQQRKANGAYTDSPFLSPAHVFEVAEAADFVGAGDFDADGHWDVVAAAHGGNALWLLPGDGHGSFGAARRIDLLGQVTTLVTGEINRADGLTDVVVGVVAADGPKALVFESPEGALRDQPEVYGLPAEATAMALGRLDDDYTIDLAVGAGSDLIVVYGRDRKLSLDETRQAEVIEAKIGQRAFPFAIKSVAIGDFSGDHRTGLSLLTDDGAVYLLSEEKATSKTGSNKVENWKSELLARGSWSQATQMVCARVSSNPGDNLVVVDSANHKLHFVADSDDSRLQASGTRLESLDVEGEPMAVLAMRLNVDALSDLVILRNGRSEPTIAITQPLATFTVVNTNDSGPGSLRQAILDANANAGLDMINFSIGSGVRTINVGSTTGAALPTITSPVVIDGTTQPGYAGSPLIELSGANAGAANGLFMTAGSSTVKGLVINRFSPYGIRLETNGGNVIAGNYIGTDVNGTARLANSFGLLVSNAPSNIIGGTVASARNIISGNTQNVSSGSGGFGIIISGAGNLVQGNYIGTDVTGTADLGNSHDGVLIGGANNTIGGTAPGSRNVISGNNLRGIGIDITSTSNMVQGNYIGTDVSGATALGNSRDGVSTGGTNNTIGGTAAGARNVISGNNGNGIVISGNGIQVLGNHIGTDVNGTANLGNSSNGVFIFFGSNSIIGGTSAGARNVISGNSNGIEISGNGNQVMGNFIGIGANGTVSLGNSAFGVSIFGSNNTIGGANAGAGNIIAFSGGNGVVVQTGVTSDNFNNAILSNSTYSNTGLGIDLGADGVSANDACDADAGTNNWQNFPVLTSASTTSIQGTLNSKANTTFIIQFFANTSCDPSGNGEGQIYLGSTSVTTDASCNASFTFPTSLSPSQVVTATATDPSNNTSEFSPCRIAAPTQQIFIVTNTNDSGPGSLRQAILDANFNSPLDTIRFSIGSGVRAINVGSTTGAALPTITSPVIIDGTTQPGYAGSPLIELNGNSAGASNGLFITAGSSTIKGLVINRFRNDGIRLETGGGNVIASNYIGTDITGTVALGNANRGVGISSSANNTIGGTVASARNVISGNGIGIAIGESSSSGNLVQGNYIGTNVTGTAALGNAVRGVALGAPNNTIGGTTAGARNVISGNNGTGGIEISGSGNLVQGNYIGTDVTGAAALNRNTKHWDTGFATEPPRHRGDEEKTGLVLDPFCFFSVPLWLCGKFSCPNVAWFDLGNSRGILFSFVAQSNTIGGTTSGAGNTIAFNSGDGILVDQSSFNNAILSNSIHSNTALGINLRFDGVTANDVCDTDTGANNLQNFPELTSVSTTSIQGTLNSKPNTTFTIQFFSNSACDPSGNGEGQAFIGSTSVTTDASCNASFTFPTSLSVGQVITATATDHSNNTSEFSRCLTASSQVGQAVSVSAASYRGGELTPEAIMAAFGSNLATTTLVASTIPLPTDLGGTTVRVRDSAGIERLAPLFFVSPGQVNYLVPLGTAIGPATVTITSGSGAVSTGMIQIAAVAPGLFSANADGQGVAAAVALRIKADGSQSFEPVAQFESAQGKFVAVPIDLGPETEQVFLILYGTGFRNRSALSAVTTTIGGSNSETLFAGEAPGFVGLDQANVRLPRSLSGRGVVDVVLTVDGKPANTVTVQIK